MTLQEITKIVNNLFKYEHVRLLIDSTIQSSYWFAGTDGKLYSFTNCPFSKPEQINSTKALSFLTHLMTISTQAEAVFHILNTHLCDYCGYCGKHMDNQDICPYCKQPEMMYKNNIFAREIILISAKLVAQDGTLIWIHEINRDDEGNITNFIEHSENGSWCHLEPITGDYWQIEEWMVPHFMHNYMPVSETLGTPQVDLSNISTTINDLNSNNDLITVNVNNINSGEFYGKA